MVTVKCIHCGGDRLVRNGLTQSLSFSKSDMMHELCLRLFLHDYNKSLALYCD
jgi:hypothetical protein